MRPGQLGQNPNSDRHHHHHQDLWRINENGTNLFKKSDRNGSNRYRRHLRRETLIPNPPSRFHDLPADVLLRIAATFDARTLRSTSFVCRAWFEALRPLREAMLLFLWGKRFRHGTSGRFSVRRDPEKALDAFVKAAERGLVMAMVDAGLVYWEMGRKEEAVEMYRRAAELGHPAGMCNLAIAYLEGGEQELEKAVKLFSKSSRLGYAKAQYNLALCLQHGRGVKRDVKEAALWYTKAAEGGNLRAMYNVSLCHSMGEELPQNSAEALIWLERAASCGHGKAQLELGSQFMQSGDNIKAFLYLELAFRAGEIAAAPLKDRVLRLLPDTSKERALQSVDYWRPRRLCFR